MGHSCPRATRSPPDPLLYPRRRRFNFTFDQRKYQVSWWEDGQILSSQIFKGIPNDSWGGKEELKCQKFWKQFCLRERWGDKLQHLVIKWRFSHEGFQGKQSWEKLLSWPSLSYKLTSFVFITTLTWLLLLKLSEESLTTLNRLLFWWQSDPVTPCYTSHVTLVNRSLSLTLIFRKIRIILRHIQVQVCWNLFSRNEKILQIFTSQAADIK